MGYIKEGSKAIGLVLLGIGAFSLLGLVLTFVFGGLSWITAPFRGAVEQRELTQADGQYRIAAYDEFFNSCEAIAAKERIIQRYLDQSRNEATPRDQRAILNAGIMAEQNARDEMIADYNADAAKADTRGNFRASHLPYQIDPNGVTSCS
jgi:hypothetical protein